MKNYVLPLAVIATVIAASCNNAANTDTDTDSMAAIRTDSSSIGDSSSIRTDTATTGYHSQPVDEASKKFIAEATSGGMLEVKLGNLAQENGSSARVKEFGAMMIRDHTDATNQLKSIAQSLGVAVPDSLLKQHQHHIDDLSKKRGAAFDKAYMSMMLNDHQQDIKAFEKETKASTKAVSDFVSQTLPVLNKHLDSAKAISRKI